MKHKNGFLLLESIISLTLIVILVSMLYNLLIFCLNVKNTIEDKIELQQQALEMTNYIEKIIGDSKGIMNTNISNYSNELVSVMSIKCKYRDEKIINGSVKDKEISLKTNNSKLFVNTLNNLGQSEKGGYEIGDYIDNMYISLYEGGKLVKLKLDLSKNNQTYSTEFDIYIRNFEGDSI